MTKLDERALPELNDLAAKAQAEAKLKPTVLNFIPIAN
jgi:hypothetical protein